jgi:hypothetical protein
MVCPRSIALALGLVAVVAQSGAPERVGCDGYLHAAANDPYGYRVRGDRCEGVYIKDLSASLRLVSFISEFGDFDPSASPLRLEWKATPSAGEIHLRANALRPRLYYEMDSIRPAGSSSYEWETSLLAAFGITRSELGIVAWTSQRIADHDRQVYLPLIVNRSKSEKKMVARVVVESGVELRELYVSLSLLNTDGSRRAVLRKDQPLKTGYYPAEESIEISLPELKESGTYLLELGAEFQGGGVSSETAWFRYGQ